MAIFGTPYLYLHIKTYKYVIMFLEGEISEIMANVTSKIYQRYVIVGIKGKPL